MNFAENLHRTIGLHRLTAADAGVCLGISSVTMSYWLNSTRNPNLGSLEVVSRFFEIRGDTLAYGEHAELLRELCDLERFERVEQRIAEVPDTKLKRFIKSAKTAP